MYSTDKARSKNATVSTEEQKATQLKATRPERQVRQTHATDDLLETANREKVRLESQLVASETETKSKDQQVQDLKRQVRGVKSWLRAGGTICSSHGPRRDCARVLGRNVRSDVVVRLCQLSGTRAETP